jgi:hypothetical protein
MDHVLFATVGNRIDDLQNHEAKTRMLHDRKEMTVSIPLGATSRLQLQGL